MLSTDPLHDYNCRTKLYESLLEQKRNGSVEEHCVWTRGKTSFWSRPSTLDDVLIIQDIIECCKTSGKHIRFYLVDFCKDLTQYHREDSWSCNKPFMKRGFGEEFRIRGGFHMRLINNGAQIFGCSITLQKPHGAVTNNLWKGDSGRNSEYVEAFTWD